MRCSHLLNGVRLLGRPRRSPQALGPRWPVFERRQVVGIEAFGPAIKGRARDAEMATGGGDGMGAGVIDPAQPLLGLPAQVGARQAFGAPWQPIAQGETVPGADPGERTAGRVGRLGHEGTSFDVANRKLTKPEATSPRPSSSLLRTSPNEIISRPGNRHDDHR